MSPPRHLLLATALVSALACAASTFASPTPIPAEPALDQVFATPPPAARPYVWWHWMGSNFSLAGITKDLEAMAASGIGGATIFNLTSAVQESQVPTENNPWPEQTYRSPAYWAALRHASSEARRLGLELGLHNTVGYSTTGGPWIDEERAIQKLVWRSVEATATDGAALRVHLPRPAPSKYSGHGSQGQIAKHYRDIGVLALPAGPDPVAPDAVIDVSARLGPDDHLTWTPPGPGPWQFLRFGHAPTGVAPHPVPDELIGKVLEADKLSLEQTRHHWQNVLSPLATELGSPVGQHLRHFLIDSYEAGHQSWTPGLRETFRQRLGYDPLPWLPTLGQPLRGGKETKPQRLVGDATLTARFEHDYRTLVSDLYYDNGWKPAADLIHAAGATLQFEPYTGPFDLYEGTALADLPMGEFWTRARGGIDHRIVAAARAAGRRLVGAEAFTGRPEISQWTETPAFLKLSADGTFASGVNRMILHHWVHQPFDDRYQPGMGMGWWGTHFGRHQTWAEPGKAFYHYLWRVQALLQRGETPADHLSVAAAEAGGDAISWRGFRENLTVRDGLVVTPAGRSYRLLHVPHAGALAPADLRRLGELLRAGATVVSPRPSTSPGLANYPACDAEVAALAAELWGPAETAAPPAADTTRPIGSGRLFPSGDLAAARRSLALRPFVSLPDEAAKDLKTHHRRDTTTTGSTDLVFVANLDRAPRTVTVSFGLAGRAPELWDAETGTRTATAPNAWRVTDGRTEVDLALGGVKSVFVVFPPSPTPGLTPAPAPLTSPTSTPLVGPWRVDFASPVDLVPSIELPALTNLADHTEPSVRHFAGTATYRLRFPSPARSAAPARERVFLDLGKVECIARVTLNGRDLGVLWHPPFRIEVTDTLRPGDNELVVAVSTTWHNRLVGDEREPADFTWGKDRGPTMGRALGGYPDWFLQNLPRPSAGRKAFVTWFYHRDNTPLRPSGLLGPVVLHSHRP